LGAKDRPPKINSIAQQFPLRCDLNSDSARAHGHGHARAAHICPHAAQQEINSFI
jgi:hypothetical protein